MKARRDTNNNAQDRSRIFGKILRIDIDQNVDTQPYYGIPDNPGCMWGTRAGGARDIWAYGFRNPWRISFDGNTLIAADVGEHTWEEVDIVQKGQLRVGLPRRIGCL
jgi:glucose/arabinose dehydrogenase